MDSTKSVQQIDDIQLLKEKILKIDSIFTLVGEKQRKNTELEAKLKKISRENIRLECKNNELQSTIQEHQKAKEQYEIEYQGKLLEETQRYCALQELMEELRARIERERCKHLKRFQGFRKCLRKNNQRHQDTKKKQAGEVQKLRNIIKYLRKQLKNCAKKRRNSVPLATETVKRRKVSILQNILVTPHCLKQNEEEEEEAYDLDALLQEMTSLPSLLQPFEEELPEFEKQMLSAQTQTFRSTVTRPVQTDSLSTARKLTQTYVSTLNAQVQCELDSGPLIRPPDLRRESRSQSIQAEVLHHIKQTQTMNKSLKSTSSQTDGLFPKEKVTLKRAIAVLKRSCKTFTISNGKLIHYSMNPITRDMSNESLLAQNVFRRLAKYIDMQYRSTDGRRRRRPSNLLRETKQLERSRDLMQLFKFGLASLPAHSDTESSGYESGRLRPARHFEDLLRHGLTPGDTSEAETGPLSETTTTIGVEDQEYDDIDNILKEVMIDMPNVLSPLEDEKEFETEAEPAPISVGERTECFVEARQEKLRKRPISRMTMLKRNIKKCNKLNVARISTNSGEIKETSIATGKKRQAHNICEKTAEPVKHTEIKELQDQKTPTAKDAQQEDVYKFNLNKGDVNKQFKQMQQKCIDAKRTFKRPELHSNRHKENASISTLADKTGDELKVDRQPSLRAEDILVILNESDHSYAAPYAMQHEQKLPKVELSNSNQKVTQGPTIDINDILDVPITPTKAEIDLLSGPDIGAIVNICSEIVRVPANAPISHLDLALTPSPKMSNQTNNGKCTNPKNFSEALGIKTRSGKTFSRSVQQSPQLNDEPDQKTYVKIGGERKRGRPPKNFSPNLSEETRNVAKRLSRNTSPVTPIRSVVRSEDRLWLDESSTDAMITRSGRILRRQSVCTPPRTKELVDVSSDNKNIQLEHWQGDLGVDNCNIKQITTQHLKDSTGSITCETMENDAFMEVPEESSSWLKELKVDTSYKNCKDENQQQDSPGLQTEKCGVDQQLQTLPKYKTVNHQKNCSNLNNGGLIFSPTSPKLAEVNEILRTPSKCNGASLEQRDQKEVEVDDGDSKTSKKSKGIENILFKQFKSTLDRCVLCRGDHRSCEDDVQLLKGVNVSSLVNCTIFYLKNDQGDLDKSGTNTMMEPLLTIKQKVVIGLLVRIETETQSGGYSTQLLHELEQHLLFNDQREPESLEMLSRFYTALCRLRQNKQRIRVFLGDLLYFNPTHKFAILFTILTSWLNVLTPYSESSSGVGIDRVLAHITLNEPNTPTTKANTAHASHDNCIGVMKNLLIQYYKFPKDTQDASDLMMSLLESYMCGGHVQFELAILILCYYKTQQWTYEKIQLIGELCKVSIDEEAIRNFILLVAKIARRMKPDFKTNVGQYLSGLISHLTNEKKTMDFENLTNVCLNVLNR